MSVSLWNLHNFLHSNVIMTLPFSSIQIWSSPVLFASTPPLSIPLQSSFIHLSIYRLSGHCCPSLFITCHLCVLTAHTHTQKPYGKPQQVREPVMCCHNTQKKFYSRSEVNPLSLPTICFNSSLGPVQWFLGRGSWHCGDIWTQEGSVRTGKLQGQPCQRNRPPDLTPVLC